MVINNSAYNSAYVMANVAFVGSVDNISVTQIGAIAEYDGSSATSSTWYDKSGNGLNATIYGNCSLQNKVKALEVAYGVIDNFTSTGIDDNATSTAITIDSSENVGIGTGTDNILGALGINATPASSYPSYSDPATGDEQFYINVTNNNTDNYNCAVDFVAAIGGTDAVNGGSSFSIYTQPKTAPFAPLKRLNIASNGDISFYEDTGTTAKLFWDAADESLGIGTTAQTGKLEIQQAQITGQFDRDCFLRLHPSAHTNSSGFTNMMFGTSTTNNYGVAIGGLRAGTDAAPSFSIRMLNDSVNGTETMRIDSNGAQTLISDYAYKYKSATTGDSVYRFVLSIHMQGNQSYEIRIGGFGNGIAHIKAMASHWTGGYALVRESYLATDSYAGMSDYNQFSTTSSEQGAWSFSRPASGQTGYQSQLVINKSAGSYVGSMKGLIIIDSPHNLYLDSIT